MRAIPCTLLFFLEQTFNLIARRCELKLARLQRSALEHNHQPLPAAPQLAGVKEDARRPVRASRLQISCRDQRVHVGIIFQFPVEGLQDWHHTNFSAFAHSGIAPDDAGRDSRQFAAKPWAGRKRRPQCFRHGEGHGEVTEVRKGALALALPLGRGPVTATCTCHQRFAGVAEFLFLILRGVNPPAQCRRFALQSAPENTAGIRVISVMIPMLASHDKNLLRTAAAGNYREFSHYQSISFWEPRQHREVLSEGYDGAPQPPAGADVDGAWLPRLQPLQGLDDLSRVERCARGLGQKLTQELSLGALLFVAGEFESLLQFGQFAPQPSSMD